MNVIDDTYPRPQLVRAQWESLDGTWSFLEDSNSSTIDLRYVREDELWASAETIQVPYPPEAPASGIGRDVTPVVWYRRTLPNIEVVPDRRTILHFEAVDYQADVWLNGHYLGGHEGGQTRFSFDITDYVDPDGANALILRALDDPQGLEQPRGKQDWENEPHVIWYRRTSGIWRSVWLENVPTKHVAAITYLVQSPTTIQTTIDVAGSLTGQEEIAISYSFEGTVLAASTLRLFENQLTVCMSLHDARLHTEPERLLWSPETPNLIDVTIEILDAGNASDRVTSYLGLRSVGVDEKDFLLNDRPYFLRMVLEQGYWPESHLAAPSSESLRVEAELIKALGFNGLRVHQKVADPRFLAWCDRLGLAVWADAAATYRFSTRSFERLAREWTEIVARDRNHPSIVAWVPYNESWGIGQLQHDESQRWAVTALHAMIKTIDPSRVVLGNDGWEYTDGDIVGVHDYTQEADSLIDRFGDKVRADATVYGGRTGGRRISLRGVSDAEQSRPIVLSEFGGVNFRSNDDAWAGYGGVSSPEEFLDRLQGLVAAAASDGLAGYCYTQLTDTLQEQNGLLTESRRPKVSLAALSRVFGERGVIGTQAAN